MLLTLSPINLLFLITYILLTVSFLFISDIFFILWLIIELHIILYMVICIPSITSTSSSLITFFLVQSVSSLLILLGGLTLNNNIILISFLINLGGFPFFSWFVYSLSLFPKIPLFLALTIQNIPTLIIVYTLNDVLPSGLILYLSIFFLIGSLSAVNSSHSLFILIIWSSSITTVWFVLSIYSSIIIFLLYLSTYSLLIYIVMNFDNPLVLYFSIVSISGFPPFPIFFINLYILYTLYSTYTTILFTIFIILLLSVFSLYLYISFINNNIVSSFSSL